MKKISVVALLLLSAVSHADWVATILHPAGSGLSEGLAGFGSKQAGGAWFGIDQRAAIWSKTSASFVSVHPVNALHSYIMGASGNQQAGFVITGQGRHATMWLGTLASMVDLHPVGKDGSSCMGAYGDKQVGYTVDGGSDHAAMWSGTAVSYISLHPANASSSYARSGFGSHQVGEARTDGVTRAALWNGSAASIVNLHPTGATFSGAYAATSDSQVGFAQLSGTYHAMLWRGTAASAVDLNPAGSAASHAYGAMESIQVGSYTVGGDEHACLWTGTAASVVDLHSKLPASYESSTANSICTDGVHDYIIGSAFNDDTSRLEAVMWARPSELAEFSFTLNKTSVAGQNSVQGTITLPLALPVAKTFTTYDNSSLVTTPATVTVAANTTLKNFQITVTSVNAPINTTVYAKLGTVVRSCPLTLAPLIPTALSFTPSPVVGGQATVCKVVVNGVAGPGGRTISIFDNSPNTTMPSTVTVPPGANSVTFHISTTSVTSVKTVTVTARVSAGEKTGTFRINP